MAKLVRMIVRRVEKILAWVLAIAVIVLMGSGLWWLATAV